MNLQGIIMFIILNVYFVNCSYNTNKLLLTIYYESLCPDSRAFILEQLQPTYKVLQDHILLKFVPFGKAKGINHGYEGFQCQHGPKECMGNLMQDCVLDAMWRRPDAEKLKYVACEMETGASASGSLQCVQKAKLRTDKIAFCMNTKKGIELQNRSENWTNLIAPKFIPSITFYGSYNQDVQDYAMKDLLGALCWYLNDVKECMHYFNDLALKQVVSDKSNKLI